MLLANFDFFFVQELSTVLYQKTGKIRHAGMYRKVVYKSRGLCAIFQPFFGEASIQVPLLLEGDLCAKSWVCKTRKSGLAHVKWQWNLTWRLFPNISNVNKHLACEKRYDLVLHRRQLATFFKLRLLFECDLCATCVLRKCGFNLSAASN